MKFVLPAPVLTGLSPPTRGNLSGAAIAALVPRSIPAHAG